MKDLTNPQPATFESVWAALQETDRVLSEKFAETERLMKENDRFIKEKFAETERLMKENDQFIKEKFAETDKQIKETFKLVGGIANSNGDVAESYFVNSFANNLHFAGQEFDSHSPNVMKSIKKLNLQDQYDLVLYNCSSVVIIEIKYKAKKEDINQVLKKAQTFKQLFPEYAGYNLYLGLAGLDVEADAEKEAKQQGIAIIKQVGSNMVVYDDNLKEF